jgi:hypothetical protein
MAEEKGFEPLIGFNPYTRFPSVRLQPLGHSSINLVRKSQVMSRKFPQVRFDSQLTTKKFIY